MASGHLSCDVLEAPYFRPIAHFKILVLIYAHVFLTVEKKIRGNIAWCLHGTQPISTSAWCPPGAQPDRDPGPAHPLGHPNKTCITPNHHLYWNDPHFYKAISVLFYLCTRLKWNIISNDCSLASTGTGAMLLLTKSHLNCVVWHLFSWTDGFLIGSVTSFSVY